MTEDLSRDVLTELEKEIGELKTLVKSLKDMVGEVKALLSDLTSPYSMLKTVPVPVASRSAGRIQKASSGHANTGKKAEETGEEAGGEPHVAREKELTGGREFHEILKDLGTALEREYEVKKPRLDIKKLVYIMRTIYNLRRALPKESIDGIIKLSEMLGLISRSDREILDTICSLVEDALKHDLTPNEQIPILYLLLKSLGYADRDLEEEVTRIISDIIISAARRRSTGYTTEKNEPPPQTQGYGSGSSVKKEGGSSK